MKIIELKKLCDKLEAERNALSVMRERLSKCNLNGHQNSISVSIDGLGCVALSEMDRGYAQRLIRGREMIMLGVKKALSAMIDSQVLRISAIEREIAQGADALSESMA